MKRAKQIARGQGAFHKFLSDMNRWLQENASTPWPGIRIMGKTPTRVRPLVVRLTADTTEVERQCSELVLLAAEAGDLPEDILCGLREFVDNMADELTFGSPVGAVGADELVIKLGLREGGRLDRCAAAIRAFRDVQVHGGSCVG